MILIVMNLLRSNLSPLSLFCFAGDLVLTLSVLSVAPGYFLSLPCAISLSLCLSVLSFLQCCHQVTYVASLGADWMRLFQRFLYGFPRRHSLKDEIYLHNMLFNN